MGSTDWWPVPAADCWCRAMATRCGTRPTVRAGILKAEGDPDYAALVKNGDNTYTLTSKDGVARNFSTIGLLTSYCRPERQHDQLYLHRRRQRFGERRTVEDHRTVRAGNQFLVSPRA